MTGLNQLDQLDQEFLIRLQQATPRLLELMVKFSQVRVLVVGDLTLDEFLTGQVERLSREAPVLILRHEHTQQIPGGGANAAYNLAKLNGQVKVVGLVGGDVQGQVLSNIFQRAGVNIDGILTESDRPTVAKTRISGHARQSVTQQIVRVDRKSDDLPNINLQLQLAKYIQEQIAQVDAVVCSDYGDGVLTSPVIQAAIAHRLTIIDTQKDLQRFAGATLFTPNLPEAEQAVGYVINSAQKLTEAGRDLLKLTQAQLILITRGEEGMSLFSRTDDQQMTEQHIPAFNRTDVYDVTGAGDTVVAGMTLALGLGASPWEAAVLGNLAASIVVRHFGTATTNIMEMQTALHTLINN